MFSDWDFAGRAILRFGLGWRHYRDAEHGAVRPGSAWAVRVIRIMPP
jgi:hypothetical protein